MPAALADYAWRLARRRRLRWRARHSSSSRWHGGKPRALSGDTIENRISEHYRKASRKFLADYLEHAISRRDHFVNDFFCQCTTESKLNCLRIPMAALYSVD